MGLGNILVLSQATGYTLAFFMSLCLLIPMSINLHNFRGYCLLYTTGQFSNSDGTLIPSWASPLYCGFTVVVGVFLLLTSVVQLIRMSCFLYSETDSSFLSAFLDSVANFIMMGAVFCASIIISGGFRTWCDTLSARFKSCDTASLFELDPKDNIVMEGFYILIGTAQFGAWCSWVCWVLLTVLSTRKLCRYHEQENIRISMARQRRRLLTASSGSLYNDNNA